MLSGKSTLILKFLVTTIFFGLSACGGGGGGGGSDTDTEKSLSLGTDFSEAVAGPGLPSGWTERWLTGDATISYQIIDSTIFPGTMDLEAIITDNSQGKRFLASFDAADNLGPDAELLMLFSDPVNEGSEHTDFRLFARAGGETDAETAYFFTTKNHQKNVRIYKYYDGPNNILPATSGPGTIYILAGRDEETIPFNTTDPWWVRFRLEGSSVKVKIWPYGSVEPGAWQLSAVDSVAGSLTLAGWQGIGSFHEGSHIFHQFSAAQLPAQAQPVNGFGIVELSPLVQNLDAEEGVTDWINEYGMLQVTDEYQRSGDYAFQAGPADYSAYQRINLADSGVTAQYLAQGVKFSFRAWQRSFDWDNDPGRIGLRFLDENFLEISSTYTDWDFQNDVYTPKSLIETIPSQAVYADIILQGEYRTGDSTGAYFDDLEVAIGVLQ